MLINIPDAWVEWLTDPLWDQCKEFTGKSPEERQKAIEAQVEMILNDYQREVEVGRDE